MENFRLFIYNKCLDFTVRISRLYTYLCNDKKEHVLSKQLLRSGTSIGANLAEAQYGISKKDFYSKGLKNDATITYYEKVYKDLIEQYQN